MQNYDLVRLPLQAQSLSPGCYTAKFSANVSELFREQFMSSETTMDKCVQKGSAESPFYCAKLWQQFSHPDLTDHTTAMCVQPHAAQEAVDGWTSLWKRVAKNCEWRYSWCCESRALLPTSQVPQVEKEGHSWSNMIEHECLSASRLCGSYPSLYSSCASDKYCKERQVNNL